MTSEEQIAMLKVLTDETGNAVLTAYLNLAKDKVLNRAYPFGGGSEVPERYHTVQVEIAAFLINKRGAEGQTTHSENGVERRYEDGDVPSSLLRQIVPFASVIGGASDASDEA